MSSGDPDSEGGHGPTHGETGQTGQSEGLSKSVDRKLLEILVCPLTKTRLVFHAQRNELISRAAGLAFPIEDGVPLLTREAARELGEGEF